MASPIGEPVDYEDCLLLGIWGRLSGRERVVAASTWSELQACLARGTRPHGRRDRSFSRWFTAEERHELRGRAMLHHVAVLTDLPDPSLDRSVEALLVDEGLILAVTADRCYFAGKRLIDVIAAQEAAEGNLVSTIAEALRSRGWMQAR